MPISSFIVKIFTIKTAKLNFTQEADNSFKAFFLPSTLWSFANEVLQPKGVVLDFTTQRMRCLSSIVALGWPDFLHGKKLRIPEVYVLREKGR